MSEELAHAFAISSMPMQMVTLEPEMPPYSSGNGMPRIPLSAKSFSMSFGYSAVWSISAARGATLSSTSSRIVSRMASCSGVSSKSIAVRLAEQLARDDDTLDLVRAFIDLEGLCVAHVALERAACNSPRLARQLERVKGDLHRGIRAVELRHRRLLRERPAQPAQPRRVIGEQPRRLDTRRHVGQEELVALLRSPLAQHPGGLFDRRLGDPERLPGDADPTGVERSHRNAEPLALRRKPVLLWHLHVLEHELPGRRAVEAHLVEDLADPQARRVGRDQKSAHASRLLTRAGACEDDV